MRRIITLYPDWDKVGGAQNVALQLAVELNRKNGSKPVIVCDSPDNVINYYKKQDVRFVKNSLKTFLTLKRDDIILSHHRKMTSLYIILEKLFLRNNRIIHIAHNTFTNLKTLTLFPSDVVAVSNGVKENLVDYFNLDSSKVNVIFNGIKDYYYPSVSNQSEDNIKILLAGRICDVKQQVELVRSLKGKIPPYLFFYFAGDGEDSNLLKSIINGDNQFYMLGSVNMMNTLPNYDYVCLFSKKEGLPLSLIEGCMFGKPLITNSLPAVLDINVAGVNGFVFPDFNAFVEKADILPRRHTDEYKRLSHNSRIRYEKYFAEKEMFKKYHYLISEK